MALSMIRPRWLCKSHCQGFIGWTSGISTTSLSEDRGARPRDDVPATDQESQAEQHHAEEDAERHLGVLGTSYPRHAELGHRVRDRLHSRS